MYWFNRLCKMTYFLHPSKGFFFSSGVLLANEIAANSQASINNTAKDTNLTGAMVTDINTIWNKACLWNITFPQYSITYLRRPLLIFRLISLVLTELWDLEFLNIHTIISLSMACNIEITSQDFIIIDFKGSAYIRKRKMPFEISVLLLESYGMSLRFFLILIRWQLFL